MPLVAIPREHRHAVRAKQSRPLRDRVVIGGLGSVLGSILGAVFLTLLPEVLRLASSAMSGAFPGMVELFASIKMGVFGLTIILFLIFEPDGMAARWRTIKNYWKLYPFSY